MMNWLTFYTCCKPLERGLNYSLMIVSLIWVASGYDGSTAEIFQMSGKETRESVIKESASLSKKGMQLDLSRINSSSWHTTGLENSLHHSLVDENDMAPRNSSHLRSFRKAHNGRSKSPVLPSGIPQSSINSPYHMTVEDNAASVVKRSVVAEPRKESFYTLAEGNSTTATYSTTSFAPFYFLNPRYKLSHTFFTYV